MSILDEIERRHVAHSEKPVYDVIFSDRVGNTAAHIQTGGLGGSEEATIRLAELLVAAGFKILVLTRDNFRDPDVGTWKGVDYRRSQGEPFRCRTLVNLRHSAVPTAIEYGKLVEWVHDVPEEWCPHEHLPHEEMDLVAVSEWQADLFASRIGRWKSRTVIRPILPDFSGYTHNPQKYRFLYASSVIKGLVPTLELWRTIGPPDAELLITNPGYDLDKVPKDLRANEKLVGILPDMPAVAELMATCEGIFYVNAWPENFSQTVAMADAIGLKTHVLCTSPWAGKGGLGETAPGNLITTSREEFITNFVRLLCKPIGEHERAKLGTIDEWISLLRLRDSDMMMSHFWKSLDGFFTFPDFYTWLAQQMPVDRPSRGVEVGAYLGQSAAYLAVELHNRGASCTLDLVDLFATGSAAQVLASLMPVRHIVRTAHAIDSAAAADLYEDGSLDFVFIDASHLYQDVKRDIAAWKPKVKCGGILAGHDFCAWPAMNFGVVEAVTESFDRWEVWRGRNDCGDAQMQDHYWPVWCVRT